MAPEGVPEMTKKSTKAEAPDRGRFSANRKAEAILRLLRGEDLEAVSRELGVTAATLSSWRDAFLDGGKAALLPRGGGAASPLCLPRHRPALRDAAGLPHLRPGPLHRLLPQGPGGG